jgi:putative endonuclease
LETNWRSGRFEIDIIAKIKSTLVFVEVKTRSAEYHDFPESSVDRHKQKSMIKAASDYIEKQQHPGPIRFDIVSIILIPNVQKLIHFRDAFFPLDSSTLSE